MKPTTITITGTETNQFTINTSSLSPFSEVVVADSNPGQTETVTVTLSASGHGALSNLQNGSYDSATGVYTVTGTTSEVTAALDGLVFTPTVADQAIRTTFAIKVVEFGRKHGFQQYNGGNSRSYDRHSDQRRHDAGVAREPEQLCVFGGEHQRQRRGVSDAQRQPGPGKPVSGRLGASRGDTDRKWVRSGLGVDGRDVCGLEYQQQRRLHGQRHRGFVEHEPGA